jgi:hypothetical protein
MGRRHLNIGDIVFMVEDGIMLFNKLGSRKNPHPSPPPQAMEGTML